jgi:hypothetical protein
VDRSVRPGAYFGFAFSNYIAKFYNLVIRKKHCVSKNK